MEQDRLGDLEQRCIQEEPPFCQAACPLGVDGRGFCTAMANGRFDEARSVLARSMPLPEILGRICDHPCQDACIRSQTGGAVAIGRLERACLERARPAKAPLRLPPKEGSVKVVGGGLSSLSCAFELAKKGYRVSLAFEGEVPGGRLLELPEEALPKSVLGDSWGLLQRLGVTRLSTGSATGSLEPGEGEAAYFGADDPSMPCPFTPGEADPKTCLVREEGVFAGGFPRDGKPSSSGEAADGKRSANSIDRFFQQASLTSGREKEFPRETRLFVPPSDIETLSPREDPVEEARRCLRCECRYCVRECTYLETYKSYPRVYARQVYNNFAIVRGVHQANRLINSCALCGLCETLCPNDFSMADLCRSAREELVERGLMPPSAHEFALLDMEQACGPKAAGFRPGKDGTAAVFFPGCQLAGTMPEQVEALVSYLDGRFGGTLGLLLGCCGAPAWWAGRKEGLQAVLGKVRETLASAGNPPLVLACSSCNEVFKTHLPEVPRVSLWEVLLEKGMPAGRVQAEPLALHDPCTARSEPAWREAVRGILDELGQPREELPLGRETTRCCGYGGLQSAVDPGLAREGARRRVQESPRDFLAYCAMCRESLSVDGKKVHHLLDLLFPPSAPHGAVGFSRRQENREALRNRLLGLPDGESAPWDTLELAVSDEVRSRLEERRILDSDIRQTLWAAVSPKGRRLVSPSGTELASLRVGNVTFWVEFLRENSGSMRVLNAWSHRMTVEVMP